MCLCVNAQTRCSFVVTKTQGLSPNYTWSSCEIFGSKTILNSNWTLGVHVCCLQNAEKLTFFQFVPICKKCCLPLNLTSGWPDVCQCSNFLPFVRWKPKIRQKSSRNQREVVWVLFYSEPCQAERDFGFWTPTMPRFMIKFSTNQASGFSDTRRLLFLSRGQSRPLADTLGAHGFPLLSCLII